VLLTWHFSGAIVYRIMWAVVVV